MPSKKTRKVVTYGCLIEKTTTGFSGYVPDLPGCVATGTTHEHTLRRLQEAVEIHLAEHDGGWQPHSRAYEQG